MLVTKQLAENAETFEEKDALIVADAQGRQVLSWGEFNRIANCLANHLLALGVQKGDCVGICMENQLHWLPIYFGVLKSGAIAVPLNYRYPATELLKNGNFIELSVLIFDPSSALAVAEACDGLNEVQEFIFCGAAAARPSFAFPLDEVLRIGSPAEPHCILEPDDDAAIYFSSGTTADPKAVVYTHATLVEAALRERENHGQQTEDNFVCIPPFYHVGAKLHWIANLLVGAPSVLMPRFRPQALFELIEQERATIVCLLLPWAQDILAALRSGELDLSSYDLSALRLIHLGAQHIPRSVLRELKRHFPWVELDVSYGLTESGGPGVLHLGMGNEHKASSIGRPALRWEAKLAALDDPNVEVCDPDGCGELLIRGPHMMRCYYKNPEATEEALKDGWLLTGDIARRDEDGFYYIKDRKKDIIISGGENISPAEVEEHIRSHEMVKDVLVFGFPHCRTGETVAALVECYPDCTCTEETMRTYCKQLPKCKQPKEIFFDTVPRNPTGKLDRKLVRNRYATDAKQKK